MTALDRNRDTEEMKVFEVISDFQFPVAAGETLFAGGLACTDGNGNLVAGVTATGLVAAGRTEAVADNASGGDGDKIGRVRPGVYRWDSDDITNNSARGTVCYVKDDHSVTSDATGRSKAGVVVDVDALGVWVATGFDFISNPAAAPSGTIAKKTVTLDDTVTGSADTDGTATSPINVGTALPTGATIIAAKVNLATAPVGGSPLSSLKLDLGWAGATEALIKDLELVGATDGDQFDQHDGGSAPSIGLPTRAGGKQVQAILTPNAGDKVSELTAFGCTIDVYYFIAF